MTKEVLHFEFDYNFKLLAIFSPLPDYRLAWFLNEELTLDLTRKEDHAITLASVKEEGFYSVFFYDDEVWHLKYNLMSNKYRSLNLIPEQKKVDYWLMIDGNITPDNYAGVISIVRNIEHVQAVLDIDPNSLKSRENFILEYYDIE